MSEYFWVVLLIVCVVVLVSRSIRSLRVRPEICERNKEIIRLVARHNKEEHLSKSEEEQIEEWIEKGLIKMTVGFKKYGVRVQEYMISPKAVEEELEEV